MAILWGPSNVRRLQRKRVYLSSILFWVLVLSSTSALFSVIRWENHHAFSTSYAEADLAVERSKRHVLAVDGKALREDRTAGKGYTSDEASKPDSLDAIAENRWPEPAKSTLPSLLFPSLDERTFLSESSPATRPSSPVTEGSLKGFVPKHENIEKMKRDRAPNLESSIKARDLDYENFGILYDLKTVIDHYLTFTKCVRRAQSSGLEYASRYTECLSDLGQSHRGMDEFNYGLGVLAQFSTIDSFVQPLHLDSTCKEIDGLWRDHIPSQRTPLFSDYGFWSGIWKALYPCHTAIAANDICVRGLSSSKPISLLQYQVDCSKAVKLETVQNSPHQIELHIRADPFALEPSLFSTRLFRRHDSSKAIRNCVKTCNEHRNSSANRDRLATEPASTDSIDYNCPMTDLDTVEYCKKLIDKQHQTIEIMCGVFGASCLIAFFAILVRVLQESRRKGLLISGIPRPRRTPNISRAESRIFSRPATPVESVNSLPNNATKSNPWYKKSIVKFFRRPDPAEVTLPSTRENNTPAKLTKFPPPNTGTSPMSVPTITIDRVRTRSRASHASADGQPSAANNDQGSSRVVSTGNDTAVSQGQAPSLRRGHEAMSDEGNPTSSTDLESSRRKSLDSQSPV